MSVLDAKYCVSTFVCFLFSHFCFLWLFYIVFNMNFRYYIFLACICFTGRLWAQQAVVKGIVVDTMTRAGLSYAGVALLKLPDSALVENVFSGEKGAFQVSASAGGNYLLWVSYVGYQPLRKPLQLTAGQSITLDTLRLKAVGVTVDTAKIEARMVAVTVKDDTIAYNAAAYNPKAHEVVSDVLERMPGIQVKNDGTVMAQGEQVQRVYVNNKPFFGDDPQMALQNLPADAIEEIQVYDAKSDQSAFSGMADGQTTKTMNIKVKKDRSNLYFGNVGAAGGGGDGTRDGTWAGSAYRANANLFRFSPSLQMALVSNTNNINSAGFNIGGPGRGSGGNDLLPGGTDGFVATQMLGVNMRARGKKTDFVADYNFSRRNDLTETGTNRQQWLEDGILTSNTTENGLAVTQTHRINVNLEHTFNKQTSLKWTPNISYQQVNDSSRTLSQTLNQAGSLLNTGDAASVANNSSLSFNSTLLLKHKFKKEGRTVSLSVTNNYGNQHRETYNTSFYTTLSDTTLIADSLRQRVNNEGLSRQNSGRFSYTEPLSKQLKLELSASADYTSSSNDRKTHAFDALVGDYETPVPAQTNRTGSDYAVWKSGATLQWSRARFTVSAGADVQQAQLKTVVSSTGQTYNFPFLNVLPSVSYSYTISKQKSIRVKYSTGTSRPSTSDLVPVPDVSNPLRITVGNPDLKQSYSHTLGATWKHSNTEKGTFVFFRTNNTLSQNAVVYATMVDSVGRQTQMPINLNGDFSSSLVLNASKQTSKKWDVEGGLQASFARRPGMVNNIQSWNYSESVSPRIGLTFEPDTNTTLSLRISGQAQQFFNSLQSDAASWTFATSAEFNAQTTLPHHWEISTNWSATLRQGLASSYNVPVYLGSATISKVVFKNQRGRISLVANDILNQGASYSRVSGQNYIEDTYSIKLRRYVLLGFSYRINDAPAPPGQHRHREE